MRARIPYQPTNAQLKAMRDEINRQVVEIDRQYELDLDAAVLYILNTEFGFGAERLKRFLELFFARHRELQRRYELSPNDSGWLCRNYLNSKGINYQDWYSEFEI